MSEGRIPSRARPLRPGDPTRIGAYEVVGFLGEGGMGVVYVGRARDGGLVAIKVVREELARHPEFRARFRREAESALRVPRFCTAEVLAADPDAAAPYLVTEFIDGPTLEWVVNREGPLQRAELDQLGVAMAAALTGIHATGVIHRDLKPSNVLLSRLGPRVIDFGIASAVDAVRLTADGQALGTPAYMAPEQLDGRPVPASDVFCWGGVMAFAATGRRPFGTGPIDEIAARITYAQPDLDGLTGPLYDVVAAAMQKDPSVRPTPARLLELLGVSGTDPMLAVRTRLEGFGATDPAVPEITEPGDGTRIDLPTGSGTLHAPPGHPAAGGPAGETGPGGPWAGAAQGAAAAGGAWAGEPVSVRFGPGVEGATSSWRAGKGGGRSGSALARRRRWARVRAVLSGLVTAAIIGGVLFYVLSRGQSKDLIISAVDVQIPAGKHGCNANVPITGTVTTNGGSGKLTYRWDLSGPNAPQGPTGVLDVHDGQKSVPITYGWQIANAGTAKFTAKLTVSAPSQPPVSQGASFSYACHRG